MVKNDSYWDLQLPLAGLNFTFFFALSSVFSMNMFSAWLQWSKIILCSSVSICFCRATFSHPLRVVINVEPGFETPLLLCVYFLFLVALLSSFLLGFGAVPCRGSAKVEGYEGGSYSSKQSLTRGLYWPSIDICNTSSLRKQTPRNFFSRLNVATAPRYTEPIVLLLSRYK